MQLIQKMGHYSKVCRSAKYLWQSQQITSQQNIHQTRRVRNIRATTQNQHTPIPNQDTQQDNNDETVDLENTFFIQEVFDSWNTVNFIKPKTFNNKPPSKYSPNLSDEIWIRKTSDKTEIDWLADTGSPRSFIGRPEAERILQKSKSSKWKDPKECPTNYRCFNNIEIPIAEAIQIKLKSRHWESPNNEILVVNSNTVKLLGRNVLGKLGFTLSQNKAININNIQLDNPIQLRIIKKYPHLCTRLGKSKNHIAKSTLKQDIHPYQHKGQRVPLHLTEKLDKAIRHLLDTKQIIKLGNCSDKVFISPVLITVKHDKSIKLALESKLPNDALEKNKNQMQSIDNLMDSEAKYISDNKKKPGNFLLSKIDLKYAYSQTPLQPKIRKHCNFINLRANQQERTNS